MSSPNLNPVPPSTSVTLSQTEHDIQAQLIAQIQTFASHTVKVSYMFLGVIVLILALAGVGGYFGLKSYEAQVARAEATEQKFNDAQKDFAVQLAAHDAQRTADAQATATLIAQMAAKAAQPPAPVVQAGLKPGAAAETVNLALQAVLSDSHPGTAPMAIEGENLVLPPATAQIWVSDEVELSKETDLVSDTARLLSLANDDKSTLSSDLNQCKATLVDAQKSVAAYKKIAVKSKWRKFLDGAKTYGLVAVGVAVTVAVLH